VASERRQGNLEPVLTTPLRRSVVDTDRSLADRDAASMNTATLILWCCEAGRRAGAAALAASGRD
jgi:hypothetical protein